MQIRLLDRFLRRGKGPGWGNLTHEGKAHYRKNADELRQKLKKAQKFHLGDIEPWRDFRDDALSENDLFLPFNPMVIQFHMIRDEAKIEGGLLFHGVEGEGIEADLFILSNEGGFFITRFFYDTARDKLVDEEERFLRRGKTPPLDELKISDRPLLDEKRKLIDLRICATDLILAGLISVAIINEGGTKEPNGYTARRQAVKTAGKSGIKYKRLVIDVEKTENWISRGGTHASPRFHLRRGHWRHYQDGRKTWIGSMEVGDKENGEVIKDYEVRKPKFWRRIIDKIKAYKVDFA